MEINYLNLKRMFNHILLNVDESMIKMSVYRLLLKRDTHECESVGCVIGHCVILDDLGNIPLLGEEIHFELWSELFTGLTKSNNKWWWCFGGCWPNDKTQILLRLKYLIDNKSLPIEWEEHNERYEVDYNSLYELPYQPLEPYTIMNILNLKRMFNHVLLNVDKSQLKMSVYRKGSFKTHECESTGCVIGHCVILDDWDNVPKTINKSIMFLTWSQKFTGLEPLSKEWSWCFSANWSNNKTQILLRLKYLIDNCQTPLNWRGGFRFKLPNQELTPYEL